MPSLFCTRFLLLLAVSSCCSGWTIEIESDPKVAQGDSVELACLVNNLRSRQRLELCTWYAPDGRTSYSSDEDHDDHRRDDDHDDDDDHRRDRDRDRDLRRNKKRAHDGNVEVELDKSRDLCTLTIRRAHKSQAGPWECVIRDDDDDELGRFSYLRVTSTDDDLTVTLDPAEKRVRAAIGDTVELICPSNSGGSNKGFRPTCTWKAPTNEVYQLVGSRGELYSHAKKGIKLAGDRSRGDCGISIRDVGRQHFGEWTCKILRTTRDGRDTEIVTSRLALLDRFRTSRLQEENTLQGYVDGDRDVDIVMNVTAEPTNKFTDFYWIVQRQYIVKEGQTYCPRRNGRRSDDCYRSANRDRLSGSNSRYRMDIEFDELTKEDVEEPVVLIKEYRNRHGKDYIKMFFVPRFEFDSDSLTDGSGGCVIDDDFVRVDRSVEFPDLCVRVRCVGAGAVDVTGLRNCDPDDGFRRKDDEDDDDDDDDDRRGSKGNRGADRGSGFNK